MQKRIPNKYEKNYKKKVTNPQDEHYPNET